MKSDHITLSMGSGGKLSSQLIEEVFLPIYGNDVLNSLDDAAEIALTSTRVAFTTDSFTVKPPFFPGGNIGTLSICGTVNDLGVKGARPRALSAGFIIEEGFLIDDLKVIAQSMHSIASQLHIPIVTGDTKVVGKGDIDGIFINTSGLGEILPGMTISSQGAKPGDAIIITGTLADHGIAILNVREGLGFTPEIHSDVAPVSTLVESIIRWGPAIRVMRDPTRGGVASVLNEIAKASRVTITIDETKLPVKKEVQSCCDLLGMDPLYIANEGKLVIFVDPQAANAVCACLKKNSLGKDAAVIGKVEKTPFSETMCPVSLATRIGTKRFVPLLEGDQLPRIC